MKKKSSNFLFIIFVILIIATVVFLLCRFIFFKDSFATVYYVPSGGTHDTVLDVEHIFVPLAEIYF